MIKCESDNTLKLKKKKMTALVDASSAIILYKAHLHLVVCELYNVVMPVSVYGEITENAYPGAKVYQQLLADKKIRVQAPLESPDCILALSGLHALDKGEGDVIELYYAGKGDFIIVDDGAAAKYCTRQLIPFINALLVPVIIRYSGQQNDVYCQTAFDRILRNGRYSRWVINFAEQCERDDLAYFLP